MERIHHLLMIWTLKLAPHDPTEMQIQGEASNQNVHP